MGVVNQIQQVVFSAYGTGLSATFRAADGLPQLTGEMFTADWTTGFFCGG
jgi:hypothetical protein